MVNLKTVKSRAEIAQEKTLKFLSNQKKDMGFTKSDLIKACGLTRDVWEKSGMYHALNKCRVKAADGKFYYTNPKYI